MNESGIFNSIRHIMREKKSIWLIAAALLVGICLMLYGGDGKISKSPTGGTEQFLDTAALEAEIKDLCERVRGVSDAAVMITIDTCAEQLYARNVKSTKSSDDSDERVEYVTTAGGLVPVGQVMPRIRGIAVVCGGGDDAAVKLRLTEMLCALFSVPASSVSIVGGK